LEPRAAISEKIASKAEKTQKTSHFRKNLEEFTEPEDKTAGLWGESSVVGGCYQASWKKQMIRYSGGHE